MPENEEKKSKFGRKKFIGHVVRNDPKIDVENPRPVEKQNLLTTRNEGAVILEGIPRQLVGFRERPMREVNKPLHQTIPWIVLKRAIEHDKEKRRNKRSE